MFNCCKKEKKSCDALKTVLIVIGAIVAVAGVAAALYSIFRKYFKVTFECGTVNDEECFAEDDDNFEPLCFCGDADEEDEEDEKEAE